MKKIILLCVFLQISQVHAATTSIITHSFCRSPEVASGSVAIQYNMEIINSAKEGYSYTITRVTTTDQSQILEKPLIKNEILGHAINLDEATFMNLDASFPVSIDGIKGRLKMGLDIWVTDNTGVQSDLNDATLSLNGSISKKLICISTAETK